MFVRLTTIQGKPEKLDDAIRVIENDIIPAAKLMPGFKNGYWYADRKSGKMLSITLFDSEKNLELSEAAATKLREGATQKLDATVKNVERYEVVASV